VLASAENSSSQVGTPAAGPRSAAPSNPIAHETEVVATGAHENAGKRELFKENTTTALVFPNGGVIRLSVPVASGQLIFLTNQQTRREVVAQVTRKRNNPSAGFYVELEFTEPAPDFWGIAFPEAAAQTLVSPQPPPVATAAGAEVAAEFSQSAEAQPDDLSPDAPAPSADEVHALMEEVEALRAQ
jgi:hypothetical protein